MNKCKKVFMVKCERHRRLARGSKYVADVAYKDLCVVGSSEPATQGGAPLCDSLYFSQM